MKKFWQNLQLREQRALLFGSVVLVLFIIYSGVISPFNQERQRLEKSVAEERELLAWMKQAARQVDVLRASGANKSSAKGSLLSVVDRSAKQNGLGRNLKQVKPEGNGVRLRFEQAGFDNLLHWLGRLGAEQGIGVKTLTLERLSTPGQVNVTIVLERGM